MTEILKCAECGYTSDREQWQEYDFACGDCGSHSGVQCPECDSAYDLVFNDIEVTQEDEK